MKRASGILAHITSLPNPYGIGSFGEEIREFADILRDCQCRYWQVLPFVPTDAFNSPYRSDSAFAGNTLFIDLVDLKDRGLLTEEELESCKVEDEWRVDFKRVKEDRERVFRLAFERMDEVLKEQVEVFAKESPWLEDYAIFKSIESDFKRPWFEWPEEYRDRDPKAMEFTKILLKNEILYQEFLQYLFFEQWIAQKEYINNQGVQVIGDIPIYVAMDSCDVWANKDLFLIKDNKPLKVAGVPPDDMCPTGQLWGHPIYNWKKMEKNGYKWWMDRFRHSFKLFDTIRIDHFRAFASYYEVDPDAATASNGKWVKGPGLKFFKVLNDHLTDVEIIAEDIGGDIDPEVQQLLADTGFPSMRITELGFSGFGDNVHLPFNYVNNSFCYLGTHDNNTLLGWLGEDLNEGQRNYALQYFNFDGPDDDWLSGGPESKCTHAFIRGLFETAAGTTIIQLQDALGLGSDCRMNTPGTVEGNWEFRVPKYYLDQLNTEWIKFFNMTYQRALNRSAMESSES